MNILHVFIIYRDKNTTLSAMIHLKEAIIALQVCRLIIASVFTLYVHLIPHARIYFSRTIHQYLLCNGSPHKKWFCIGEKSEFLYARTFSRYNELSIWQNPKNIERAINIFKGLQNWLYANYWRTSYVDELHRYFLSIVKVMENIG